MFDKKNINPTISTEKGEWKKPEVKLISVNSNTPDLVVKKWQKVLNNLKEQEFDTDLMRGARDQFVKSMEDMIADMQKVIKYFTPFENAAIELMASRELFEIKMPFEIMQMFENAISGESLKS